MYFHYPSSLPPYLASVCRTYHFNWMLLFPSNSSFHLQEAKHRHCCRVYWCLDYSAHFHDGCLTIGGLHDFLMKSEAYNSAQALDQSRSKIETAFLRQRFCNPFRLLVEGVKKARRRGEEGKGREFKFGITGCETGMFVGRC